MNILSDLISLQIKAFANYQHWLNFYNLAYRWRYSGVKGF